MAEEKKLTRQDAALVVYFSKQGKVIKYETKEPCHEKASGKKVTPEFIHKVISENGNKVDVTPCTIINTHGSPGCIIYLFDIPICICCPPEPE